MKTQRTFEMNGISFSSMLAIARELGVSRIYPRDFSKYGITETTVVVDAEPTPVIVADEPVADEPVADAATPAQPKVDRRHTRRYGNAEEIQHAQDMVNTSTIEEFTSYIRRFTIDALLALANAAGIQNTWETITNTPIRRMRLFMELKAHYYPGEKVAQKGSTEWKNVDMKSLQNLAKSHKVVYKKSNDSRIQRMLLIMAIKAANLTLADLPQPKAVANA